MDSDTAGLFILALEIILGNMMTNRENRCTEKTLRRHFVPTPVSEMLLSLNAG